MKEERGAKYGGIISALEPTLGIDSWATEMAECGWDGVCGGANGKKTRLCTIRVCE